MDKFPSRERATHAALEPRVSAIVVVGPVRVHGGRQSPLELCLRGVLAEPWIDDVVIVDHGAPQRVSSMLRALRADRRDVSIVSAEAKAGAARAANLGASHARGRWLLFLDPEVVLRRGAVERMAAAGGQASSPWIVGGRLTNLDGRERPAVRTGALDAWSALAVALNWPNPSPRKRRGADQGEPARVAAVSGAFMLVPLADFRALNGFDEDFATDAADLDLCRRATDAGGSVLFQAGASGVQFRRANVRGRRQAQGLALLAARSAKTPAQRAFAAVARPAFTILLTVKDFVAGRPPLRASPARRRQRV